MLANTKGDDPRLAELLSRWEEFHEQGRSLSVEELCSTCPELAEELGRHIALLRRLDPLLGDTEIAAPDRVCPAPAVGSSRQSATARADYRDLRFHAAGALGEVFMARNAELNRDVALKFLKAERARDPESCRRFLQEAEVTGRLEHPGVVPIYALGTDATGAPCYAMRFIRGATLQDAIDTFHAAERPGRDSTERSLAFHELLNRFTSICSTMGYAHSRGILHRDLKPRNVMLGKYDETLVVDWGLAKPFDRDESARSVGEETLTPSSGSSDGGSDTPTVGVVGTPAYMSPEQAEARWEIVGPASDQFSLGAILYAILTGQAPFQGRTIEEVMEKVERCEFPAPRQVKPTASRALEAVCIKAMEMRPEDRYATALDLAADVRRWMADEPVSAWREPLALRARRWMRRHRTLVISTVAVLLFGLIGLAGFATILARKNRELDTKNLELANKNQELDRQRQRAEAREELAIDAVKKFRDAVQANAELKNRHELEALRKALLKEPLEFFRKLRDQLQADRDTRPAALSNLAAANFDLASITSEIGSIPDAIRSYSESLAIRERLARDHPDFVQYQNDLAKTLNNLGNQLRTTGRPTEALESYRRAVAIKERLAHDHPTNNDYQTQLATSYNNLGVLLVNMGHPAESLEFHQRALAIHERLARANPSVIQYQSHLAAIHDNLGVLLNRMGRPAQSLESYHRAQAIDERLVRDHPDVTDFWLDLAGNHTNIGVLLSQTGHLTEALESHRRALAINERLAHDHPSATEYLRDLAVTCNNVANLLGDLGHRAEALRSYRQALETWERLVRDNPAVTEYQRGLAIAHNNIGATFYDMHQPTLALESYGRALAIRERLVRDLPSDIEYQTDLGLTLGNQAQIEMSLGRSQEARQRLDRAIELERKALAAMPSQWFYQQSLRTHLFQLAKVHQALNQPIEAARVVAELVQLTRERMALARGNRTELYNGACALAMSVPLTRGVQQQQALAAEAVQLLRQAIAAGWTNAQHASRDPDLNPLRDREDFRQILAELFDCGFPADPLAR